MLPPFGPIPQKAEAQVRSRASLWLVVPVWIGLVIGGWTAWQSMQQSLWIDELHTAWVATGPWSQLVSRAAIGNQTPLYFAWQWLLSRTFGETEVVLRASSLLAWVACLALVAVQNRPRDERQFSAARPSFLGIVAVLALDRLQIFFASEARPYMMLSLVVLLGWLALSGCFSARSLREAKRYWLAWLACATVAMWLQPTAALFVGAQVAYAVLCTSRTGLQARPSLRARPSRGREMERSVTDGPGDSSYKRTDGPGDPSYIGADGPGGSSYGLLIVVAVVWLSLCVGPMRYVLEPAWQGRQAWAAFARDVSPANVLRQFPLIVYAVPGLIACVVVAVRRILSSYQLRMRVESTSEATRNATSNVGIGSMWLCAWALPLAAVIVLTASDIAPLMHARYLFAATIPLALWTATMLSKLPGKLLASLLVMAMLSLQTYQQGSLSAWLSGRLAVVDRGEDWRGLVARIDSATPANSSQRIYCACSFIEGSRPGFAERSPLHKDYLSLPLRTLYPITSPAQVVSLLNDPRTWLATIESPPADENQTAQTVRWLIVRVSASGLSKRLQISGIKPIEQFDFGAVQLVRF